MKATNNQRGPSVRRRVAFVIGVMASGGVVWRVGAPVVTGVATAQIDEALGLWDDLPVAATGRVVDVPAGVFDDADVGRVPGVLPLQEAPVEVQAKVQALAGERERIMRRSPSEPGPGRVIEPPDDPEAPPRVDSGDPDPDRATGAAVALPQHKDSER